MDNFVSHLRTEIFNNQDLVFADPFKEVGRGATRCETRKEKVPPPGKKKKTKKPKKIGNQIQIHLTTIKNGGKVAKSAGRSWTRSTACGHADSLRGFLDM